MIIFTDRGDLIDTIKELYTKTKIVPVNFTSAYSGFGDCTALATRVNKIPRPEGLTMPEFLQEPVFDERYATTILTDVKMFEALMRIILNDFEGNLVIMLVRRDDYRDGLMEAFSKFLQQRYGKRTWILEDAGDTVCIDPVENDYDSDGILRLDEDRKKYLELVAAGQCAMVMDPVNVEV